MVSQSGVVSGKKIAETVKAGEKIYEKVKSKYLKEHKGELLVIDPKSGDVFLGKSGHTALAKARKAHPGGFFYTKRIGYNAVEQIRSYGLL